LAWQTDQWRFYCTVPHGKTNGRLYPAWQFVGSVSDVLPEVLAVLKDKQEKRVHARFVTAADELNELAPAEVFAVEAFATRRRVAPSQKRILSLRRTRVLNWLSSCLHSLRLRRRLDKG
jgi:hypothetical protein